MIDTPERCNYIFCNHKPEFKVSYTDGRIVFVCPDHRKDHEHDRDKDKCIIETIIFKQRWIIECEQYLKMVDWLDRFIEENNLKGKTIEFLDDNNLPQSMTIETLIEIFERSSLIQQSVIKNHLISIFNKQESKNNGIQN